LGHFKFFFLFAEIFASQGVPCINGTGGKFATNANDTGGKFATGVNYTGDKFATRINDTRQQILPPLPLVLLIYWWQIFHWCQ
jgi:hypothetical protein